MNHVVHSSKHKDYNLFTRDVKAFFTNNPNAPMTQSHSLTAPGFVQFHR